ncbi:hypothetical protein Tsubulata_009961 [Turnera subulata]|uniref:Dehydrogenase E1 component domain-containing protein n=1 Tax=Turnera subulata TaxID=218843 RepID=A0A9Q0G3N4_9ROSI|nr:hypothetical protein Tsubulata_009961 [Turnera subulata]
MQALDFPGGKVTYTPALRFISESSEKRVPCYRVCDDNGDIITGSDVVNRHGDPSNDGHNILRSPEAGEDFLLRHFNRTENLECCYGEVSQSKSLPTNALEIRLTTGKGGKCHTQLPQAVGVAYSLKMDKKEACVVTYTGDGATSEGDFHAALNFAAVMDAPVVFICRNNGWAISTHITEQFRSDGIVVKGQGYGIRSIRVDGNDTLAVYGAISTAREMAIYEQRPILVEALTYRVGHHSTSDDSTKYRPVHEIEHWKMARNPVNKFRNWVEKNGWWSDAGEYELRKNLKEELLQAIQMAERTEKHPLRDLFTDVYDLPPSNLCEQEKELRESINKHPQDYPFDIPLYDKL